MAFSLRLLPVFQMNARKLVGVILLMAVYERDGVLSPTTTKPSGTGLRTPEKHDLYNDIV